MKNLILAVLTLIAALGLSACGDGEQTSERVRAIKPYYVSEPAGGDVRRFSGTIVAADTSSLSFSVPGTVATVTVVQGDRVQKGQVLATLDPEQYQYNVAAAESELQSAEAAHTNSQLNMERQEELFQKGWVSKAAYDQAVASLDSAEANLNLAKSRLSSARRDLQNTRLVAPFDGVIGSRDVEPFVEVGAGQNLFSINSEGAMELEISVPDSLVSRFTVGLPVAVRATTIATCGCEGRITEIGSVANAANSVDVKVSLLNPPAQMIPGMAAEATVILSQTDNTEGYLVPLVAVAPGDDAHPGYVFKYDPETGTVIKVGVEGKAGRENLVAITSGVNAGDILAAAGVSFLRDGQKVKLEGDR